MVGTDILELTLGSVEERTWGLKIASRVVAELVVAEELLVDGMVEADFRTEMSVVALRMTSQKPKPALRGVSKKNISKENPGPKV